MHQCTHTSLKENTHHNRISWTIFELWEKLQLNSLSIACLNVSVFKIHLHMSHCYPLEIQQNYMGQDWNILFGIKPMSCYCWCSIGISLMQNGDRTHFEFWADLLGFVADVQEGYITLKSQTEWIQYRVKTLTLQLRGRLKCHLAKISEITAIGTHLLHLVLVGQPAFWWM